MADDQSSSRTGDENLLAIAMVIALLANSEIAGAQRLADDFLEASIADANMRLFHRPHTSALAHNVGASKPL